MHLVKCFLCRKLLLAIFIDECTHSALETVRSKCADLVVTEIIIVVCNVAYFVVTETVSMMMCGMSSCGKCVTGLLIR